MVVTSRTFSKAFQIAVYAVFSAVLCFSSFTLQHAFAQNATSGAIGGTVKDNGGALLPGAVVTVTSVETQAMHTAKTNASGEYNFQDMQPGAYTVDFTADGFQKTQITGVTVTVGSLSTVSPKLTVGSVTAQVDVSDKLPLMDMQNNTISTTLDQNNIDNLPINGRRYSDFALLTPGVVSNGDGYGLLSFRGISFLLNNNTVDGADDNQAYFSEARGRTRTAYAVTQGAVQEFQVNTSNYSAQYGRAAGGVINTVTKSGTNKPHGELYYYDRDNDLGGATNPYTLLTVKEPDGTYGSQPYKPTDWRKDWGFGIGGPIIHDKLFWFYAYEQERRNFPGTSRPIDPGDLFAPSSPTLPVGETCSTTQFTTTNVTLLSEGDFSACAIAALYGVNFQAGSAYYQQGLGIMQTLIGTVPRRQDQVINFPKIDYQINDRNHLALVYNRLRYSSPNGLYQPATETEGVSGWGDDFIKEDFGIAHLTTVINNSMVNDALVQYGRDFEYTYQNPPQTANEYPLANNQFGAAPGTQIGYFLGGGIYAGANPDLPRAADPDERRLQLLDSVTWSHGKHVFKFGLEYNKVSDYVNNLYNGNGSYSFDFPYLFIAQYENLTTGIGNGTPWQAANNNSQLYYGYSQGFGNPIGDITTREYAGYATDDWRITPKLTLTLGVRYEYEYVPSNPTPNTSLEGDPNSTAGLDYAAVGLKTPNTLSHPDDRNNIGPRLGFAYNLFGNDQTILRGGYGIYYGRIINSNILQTYLDSGNTTTGQSDVSIEGSCSGLKWPAVPSSLSVLTTTDGCGLESSTVAYLDPHMQNPLVHEADLALDQDLGHATTLSLTYMLSLGRELPSAIDTNINLADTYEAPFTIGPNPATNPPAYYTVSTTGEGPTGLSGVTGYPQPAQNGTYTTLPHGGLPLPFASGRTFTSKVFLEPVNPTASNPSGRLDPNFYQILDVRSDINSTYHALAAQIVHRFSHGYSILSNITWSHAMDGNPYESTVVPSFTTLDPTNPRGDYGNSNTNVPIRFVFAATYEPHTHFRGFTQELLDGWRIAPLVQAQNGLPFTPYVSSHQSKITVPNGVDTCATTTCTAYLAYTSINGAGSSADRLPWLERNTYKQPSTVVFDMRLAKNFYIPVNRYGLGRMRFEIFTELFNVMNHQNITGVSNDAYSLSTSTTGSSIVLTPYVNPQFGSFTNANSNYTYSPRQLQIAARLHF
jgi:hypothetical protein